MLGLRNLVSASLRITFSTKEVVCIDEHMNMFTKAKPKFDFKERRA